MEEKLKKAEFKKALLFDQIESMSRVDDSLYLSFGKICAEVLMLKKEVVRLARNTIQD